MTRTEMTLSGMLLAGPWRSQAEVEKMSADEQRNTLIVEVQGRSNQSIPYFQGLPNPELIGRAGVIIFLKQAGLCDDAALRRMSDADHRKLLLKTLDAYHGVTDLPLAELEAMSLQQLVPLAYELRATPKEDPKQARGTGTLQNPLLIDPVRKILDSDDRYYVQVATHFNPGVEMQFNTVTDKTTKSVIISGVKLVFDRGDNYRQQMSFQGQDVLDLKSLELRADQVVIRVPLRFPGTTVTIRARELIFEDTDDTDAGTACIDTSPAEFKLAAASPFKTKDGKYPADSSFKPTYVAADGKNGEKAGEVHLYVRRIKYESNGRKRIICRGSGGQAAEPGDRKPYEPKSADQPAADKGKHLLPVKVSDIRGHLRNVSDVEEKSEGNWRWPDGGFGVSNLDSVPGGGYALNNEKIVHLRLIMHNCNAWVARARRTFFPGGDSMRTVGCEVLIPAGLFPNPARVGCVEGELAKYKTHTDAGRQRPGDGEDAYPGGKPGDGGAGGVVVSHLGVAPIDPAVCDIAAGNCGTETPAVKGGTPGNPAPAYWGEMYAIQRDAVLDAPLNPTFNLTEVSAKSGADAPSRKGVAGGAGRVETQPENAQAWLHPDALRAVVAYAQDAFRNGQRTTARSVLNPYYFALSLAGEGLAPELLGKLNEIVSIRTNLDNNLDFYGNPPGWVPRLDLKSNYQIWHWFSIQASKVLYFASKMEHYWDRLDDKSQAISQTSRVVKEEMDAMAAALGAAFTALKAARKDMEEVTEQFQARQAEVDALRLKATALAKTKIQEQRIFSGAMKLIGGLAEMIPVGQPYLGLAGKTVATVGDFDWNQPDSSRQLGALFTKLGKEADDFLDKNEDRLVSLSGAGVDKPTGSATDLKNQIKQAKAAVENIESKSDKLDAKVEQEWTDVLVVERERLSGEIKSVKAAIEELGKTGTEAQVQEKRAELTAFEAELALKAKLRLGRAKAKLTEQLANLENSVKDSARAKLRHEQELIAKVKALEAKKADFAGQMENYKEDKKAAEKKTSELIASLSGLGDGIAKVGQGIVALSAPYDDKEVNRMAEDILAGSDMKADYLKLLGEVRELNLKKAAATGLFCMQQKMVSTCSSRISAAMLELNALTNQRQVADAVLDQGMKTYLRGMQDRAKSHLLWAQYHFVKAWQYEYLDDVGDDFYNLEQWVSRFLKFEQKRCGIQQTKTKLNELSEADQEKVINTFLSDEDFLEIGESVRQEQSLELVRNLLNQRQHHPGRKKERFVCTLSEAQLKTLAETGKLGFSLVSDFQVVSLKDLHATVADINLEIFAIDSEDEKLNVRIEFLHSGVSVLLKGDKKYYKFQKSPDEQPVLWRFSYNHSVFLRLSREADEDVWVYQSKKIINKNEDVEEAANEMLKEEFGDSLNLKYTEYMPSAFSEITLWLNRGQYLEDPAKHQALLKSLGSLKKVQFAVDIVHQGTLTG